MKIKLPTLHSDKNTNTTIYVVIAIVVIFAIYRIYQKIQENRLQTEPLTTGTVPTGTTPIAPKAPVYTNDSVMSLKSPTIKSDRVQWIQNAYNKYAKNRKLFGKSPNWAIISEDGVFGKKTEQAVYTLMGKKSASWTEVKKRTDYLQDQLTNANFNYNQ